jgi:hypothetical protein
MLPKAKNLLSYHTGIKKLAVRYLQAIESYADEPLVQGVRDPLIAALDAFTVADDEAEKRIYSMRSSRQDVLAELKEIGLQLNAYAGYIVLHVKPAARDELHRRLKGIDARHIGRPNGRQSEASGESPAVPAHPQTSQPAQTAPPATPITSAPKSATA